MTPRANVQRVLTLGGAKMSPDRITRVQNALEVVAQLADADPEYMEIFKRLDVEYLAMVSEQDPIARMRATMRLQSAIA